MSEPKIIKTIRSKQLSSTSTNSDNNEGYKPSDKITFINVEDIREDAPGIPKRKNAVYGMNNDLVE